MAVMPGSTERHLGGACIAAFTTNGNGEELQVTSRFGHDIWGAPCSETPMKALPRSAPGGSQVAVGILAQTLATTMQPDTIAFVAAIREVESDGEHINGSAAKSAVSKPANASQSEPVEFTGGYVVKVV